MSLRRSFAAAAVVAVTVAFAADAFASPWGLQPGDFYSELSGSLFSSQSYFRDSDEARIALGGRLEERVVRSRNEFGWKKWATVWIDMPLVSRSFVPDGAVGSNSTGLGDLDMGLRFPWHVGALPMAFELGWTLPLGSNRALFPGTAGSGGLNGAALVGRSSIPLQDTSTFFSQGLTSGMTNLEIGGTAGKRAYWTLGAGYRTSFLSVASRDTADRFADFTTASASLGIWFTNSLLVSGDFRGEWQVSEGGAYDRILEPAGTPLGPELKTTRMLAGPRFTYRVDERMDVFAGSWHTPGGRNALHLDQYYCGIAWKHTGLDRLAGALGGTKAH